MLMQARVPLLLITIFVWANTTWAAQAMQETWSLKCREWPVPVIRGQDMPWQAASQGVIQTGPFSKLQYQLHLNGGSMDEPGRLQLTTRQAEKVKAGDRLVQLRLFELKLKPSDPATDADATPKYERVEVPLTVHQTGGGFDRGKNRRSATGIIDLPQVDASARRKKVTEYLTALVASEVKSGRMTPKAAEDFKKNLAAHVSVHESMYVENRIGKYQIEIFLVDDPLIKTTIDVEVTANERTSFFDHPAYKLPD